MGITVLEIEIASPSAPDRAESVELLVDSGALYSLVPTEILERLGIQSLSSQEFRLADGSKVVRRKGGAVFRYRDRVGVADVIFGEEGDARLLGVLSLEALGLGLDPIRRQLMDLPMILGGWTGPGAK